MSARRLLSLWGPVLVYAAALYAASARSDFPPIAGQVWDKALHGGAWAGFTMLSLRATHGGRGPLRLAAIVAAVLVTLGYGIADEFHQSFVPGRDASSADLLADGVGAALAVAAAAARQAVVSRRAQRTRS